MQPLADMLLPGSVFAWSILGRPLTFMVLEAKFFSVLVVLADQYKRTQSFPWPLHPIVTSVIAAWSKLTRAFRLKPREAQTPSAAESLAGSSDQSVELTLQADNQVGLCYWHAKMLYHHLGAASGLP